MSDHPKDLLLEDYRYRANALEKNEQGGETRVNLFIGLVTLVGGLMASLLTAENNLIQGEVLRFVVLAGLFSMLLLGVITMLRMITRNQHTDEAKRDLDVIRQTFRDNYDDDGILLQYSLFVNPRIAKPEEPSTKQDQDGHPIRARKIGGLAHTTAALNSLLLAGLVTALLYPLLVPRISQENTAKPVFLPLIICGLTAFGLGLYLQLWYIERQETKTRDKIREGYPTHAGGVVFRRSGEQVEYLLVRPSSGATEWVLPKGHIERKEEHRAAARREVREESGVYARPICLVDRVQFQSIDAKFYLMEAIMESRSPEGREILWATPDQAIEKLTYIESRYLVHMAEKLRSAKGSEPGRN
jgi:8-oxo-dGTP pyrophosphatase MutT (NUDIX family)